MTAWTPDLHARAEALLDDGGYCPTCTRRYRLDHLHRLATHREPS